MSEMQEPYIFRKPCSCSNMAEKGWKMELWDLIDKDWASKHSKEVSLKQRLHKSYSAKAKYILENWFCNAISKNCPPIRLVYFSNWDTSKPFNLSRNFETDVFSLNPLYEWLLKYTIKKHFNTLFVKFLQKCHELQAEEKNLYNFIISSKLMNNEILKIGIPLELLVYILQVFASLLKR